MAKPERKELVEKLKGMTVEDRTLFREALQEAEPEAAGLSMEELSKVREMLAGLPKPDKKDKKPKSISDRFVEIFGE